MNKDDFKYLSQEFDSKVLDLVKQKGFCPYECMNNFEKFIEKLPSKKSFTVQFYWDYEHVVKVWNTFEMRTMTGYHDLYLKGKARDNKALIKSW